MLQKHHHHKRARNQPSQESQRGMTNKEYGHPGQGPGLGEKLQRTSAGPEMESESRLPVIKQYQVTVAFPDLEDLPSCTS